MFPFALWNSQSMFIAGVTMIAGILLLRMYVSMRKTSRKPNPYELPRRQYSERHGTGHNAGRMSGTFSPVHFVQNQQDFSETADRNHVPAFDFGAVQRPNTEQQEVELLTLSRQIKAEIDTKIVALQLMIADADRVLQQLGDRLPHTRKILPSTPSPAEQGRGADLIQDKIAETPIQSQHDSLPQEKTMHSDPSDVNHIVVEDPFAINDFGFDKAMRDLEQLASGIPTFDAIPTFDIPSRAAVDTPPSESYSGSGNLPVMPRHTEIGQDGDTMLSPLPQWDMPISYPISDYRPATDSEKPTSYQRGTAFPDALTDQNSSLPCKQVRRKSTYTNKLLTQVPPQLEALLTNEPVGRMGSKPRRAIGQDAQPALDDEPLAPPVIPKISPPNARILVESSPITPTEAGGLDKMAVRKAKRHQLQYLIEKGMTPKEIAAHLEMPVGEVELIFSLHQRLSAEAEKPTTRPPRIISAENVVV